MTTSREGPPAPSNAGAPALSPADQLLMLASGAWVTQMIHVAAELAVADQLAGGERGVEELAAACGADADSLFRLLRGLASLGIFQETGPRRFALTPLAELLRGDHPQSLRQFARMLGAEHYLSWDDLLHSVRSGENAFRHRTGMGIFDWYQQHPERGAIFDAAMGDYSRRETEGLLAAYDFSGIAHLVDVGGGQGALLQQVLTAFPQLRGTVFDHILKSTSRGCPTERAVRRVQLLNRGLQDDQARLGRELMALLLGRRSAVQRIRGHYRSLARMRLWLLLHVPLSMALLFALAGHIVSVFIYW